MRKNIKTVNIRKIKQPEKTSDNKICGDEKLDNALNKKYKISC